MDYAETSRSGLPSAFSVVPYWHKNCSAIVDPSPSYPKNEVESRWITPTTARVLTGPLLAGCRAWLPEAAGQCWQSMKEKCDEIEHQAHHGSCGDRDVERGRGGLQAW